MPRKKIAIYVEGQTEQILLNHLILTWWYHSGIRIENLKLSADQNSTCFVPNFNSNADPELEILFLITDVQGVGTLTSAIADRANNQHHKEFEIIGLRDLDAEDYRKECKHSAKDAAQVIINYFRIALEKKGCLHPQKIDIFFAIMEIEAWLLAFPTAVSKWARISENDVMQKISNKNSNIEMIKDPSALLDQIGESSNRKKVKAYDAVKSIVHSISREEIEQVYESCSIPSFSKFWQKIISLSHSA